MERGMVPEGYILGFDSKAGDRGYFFAVAAPRALRLGEPPPSEEPHVPGVDPATERAAEEHDAAQSTKGGSSSAAGEEE